MPSRSVLITGASTGIGAACALELDRLGWEVFAGVRSELAARQLRQQASGRLAPVRIDLTDVDGVVQAAQQIASVVGDRGLAGLVNNAGVVVAGPVELVPLAEFRRQLEVNLIGQVAVIQAVLPLLRAGQGRIVNIGSVTGRLAPPYLGAYAASKHALEALTDVLRVELRRWGIRVSIVEPASVKTPLWDKAQSEADRLAHQISPQLMGLYGEDLQALRRTTWRLAAQGMPVERVVRAVVHALTARRPKTRYPVGAQTRWAIFAVKFLPDRTRDWFVRKALGLP
ncbi:MAG: SDR family NAD(P)-dependent oxidoreductase [Thermoguttaceae bacterium]